MPLPLSTSAKVLMRELQSVNDDPIEGFRILHVDDANIFDWQIAIFGPPSTCYAGGYFKAHIRFPGDYPFSAPSFRFLTKIWHPNIYENGEVCISILHPPIDDPQGGELPGERWNPTQSVRTVLLSIISILNDPNTFSPANVDASVAFRNWKEGKDNKYKDVIQKQIEDSQAEAERDGIHIPMTHEEYCIRPKVSADSDDLDFEMYDEEEDDEDDGEEADYSITSSALPSAESGLDQVAGTSTADGHGPGPPQS
jgi:ubiquitin-conjugating enzyme E2 R